MIRWFRRRRPEPAPIKYAYADIMTACAWSLTLTEWDALTDFERRECRRTMTAAPNFRVTR
jgi:hypothetical protein